MKVPDGRRTSSLILCVILLGLLASPAMAFEAEDLPLVFGTHGWQGGLSLSQERIKHLGFLGYEITGVGGYFLQDLFSEHVSSWFAGHKEVFVGNVGYTLEFFVGNTERPLFSIFTNSVDPHIGAYGEVKRVYGDYGHGLSGMAQLFMNAMGEIEYCISPYVQFTRQGVWRISASLGSSFGLGLSYLESGETLQFDITLVNDEFSFYVLLSVPEQPIKFGAGWNEQRMQAFLRYTF
ncbi:MAG: hypothetical protein WAQ17_02815 [Limnochordia bacterium]